MTHAAPPFAAIAAEPQTDTTLAQALADAVGAGLVAVEARMLLSAVTGLARTQLLTRDSQRLDVDQRLRWQALVERRLAGEPIAYLVGHREFYGRDFAVGPGVLIPRPETELLVELALQRCAALPHPALLDLGTGSGAIAVTLAAELPAATVVAIDVSADALAIADHNAQRLLRAGVRPEFRCGSWYEPLNGADRFDLIVSNPPYIASGDTHLTQGDLRFEPRGALTDGADGLTALRRVIGGAPARLRPGGWLLVEHGHDQAQAVRALFAAAGFEAVCSSRDLAGIERATGGRITADSAA